MPNSENYGFQVPMCQDFIANQMNKTFTYKSNTLFYSFLPNDYRDYYVKVVKTSLEWLDGYVFGFHSVVNGIFSMQLCPALIKGLATSIKGGKLLFEKVGSGEDVDEALNFLTHNWKDNNLDDATLQGITTSMAGACPCLKLNISNKGLWVEAVRQDNFYFNSDCRDKVLDARFFIKNFIMEYSKDGETEKRNYFLVEHRYFKVCEKEQYLLNREGMKPILYVKGQNIPMVEYYVCAYFGTANNNTMARGANDKTFDNIDWEQLPQSIRNQIKDNYGAIKIGVPQPLPFVDYLGCELLKYGGKDVTCATANFGNSLISNLSQYFMFYDYAWSLRARDLYLGKGTVLLPKQFSLNNDVSVVSENGIGVAVKTPFNGVLDDAMYQNYDSADPNATTPKSIQFDYRISETTSLLDDIIKKCATMIGVSPKMFASYLSQGNAQKTATEVDAEDDISIAYINLQRSCFEPSIQRLIDKVLLYYGKSTKIRVKFGTPSLVNKERIQKRVIEQLKEGLIDLEEAIRQLYPDRDEEAIKEMVVKAKAQQEENRRNNSGVVYTNNEGGF